MAVHFQPRPRPPTLNKDNEDKEDKVGQDDLTPTTEAVTANTGEALAPTDTHTHNQAPRVLAAQVARRRESARLKAQRSSPSEPDSLLSGPVTRSQSKISAQKQVDA